MSTEELLGSSPFDDEDLAAELRTRPGGARLSTATLVLGAAVLLMLGVLGGIQAEKAWGSRSGGGSAGAAAVRAGSGGAGGPDRSGRSGPAGDRRAGRFGDAGAGGTRRAGGSGATIGTVTLVDGKKIYVRTFTGSTVIVTTGDDTEIQVSKPGRAKDLKPGSTVIVQGEQGADGTVAATSVQQSSGLTGGFSRMSTRNGGRS